jgi:hypothetical protein
MAPRGGKRRRLTKHMICVRSAIGRLIAGVVDCDQGM